MFLENITTLILNKDSTVKVHLLKITQVNSQIIPVTGVSMIIENAKHLLG